MNKRRARDSGIPGPTFIGSDFKWHADNVAVADRLKPEVISVGVSALIALEQGMSLPERKPIGFSVMPIRAREITMVAAFLA